MTRLLPYPVAQAALSVAAPLMIPLIIALWLIGLVTGFALVYFGGMSFGDLISGGGSQPSLPTAFRLSWVTLSTIGFVEISPSNMAYSVTVALEALLGAVILTFSITYFLNVHRSILSTNRLVAELHHRLGDDGRPLSTIAAYMEGDGSRQLERWLERLHENVVALNQGLQRFPIVYFYRPRRRAQGLPYILTALQDIAGGLAHCLPDDAGMRHSPALVALNRALAELIEDLEDGYVPVHAEAVLRPVSRSSFEMACRGHAKIKNRWVERFTTQCSTLAGRKACTPDRNDDTLYDRYREWLPQAVAMSRFVDAVRFDLGYEENLRPHRSSRLLAWLSQGPKDRPQSLQTKAGPQ
ncbi:potassium channel family protein [uncultured Algimonas sp.]|uniref:potassium channel family protein n=1 Tax=uncultured Algimonas sp. TaxID=1547920 RepID=UPI002615D87A|nr:potassium channel family protein [uncultured Algimonas sp.]